MGHAVKSIGEVKFDKYFVCGPVVAVNPRTSGVDGFLSPGRDGNSNLRWPEKVTSTFSHGLEQTFASQTVEKFPNSNWSQSNLRLGHRNEASSSKEGGDGPTSITTPSKQVDKSR